jgi:hypothetical protein
MTYSGSRYQGSVVKLRSVDARTGIVAENAEQGEEGACETACS